MFMTPFRLCPNQELKSVGNALCITCWLTKSVTISGVIHRLRIGVKVSMPSVLLAKTASTTGKAGSTSVPLVPNKPTPLPTRGQKVRTFDPCWALKGGIRTGKEHLKLCQQAKRSAGEETLHMPGGTHVVVLILQRGKRKQTRLQAGRGRTFMQRKASIWVSLYFWGLGVVSKWPVVATKPKHQFHGFLGRVLSESHGGSRVGLEKVNQCVSRPAAFIQPSQKKTHHLDVRIKFSHSSIPCTE